MSTALCTWAWSRDGAHASRPAWSQGSGAVLRTTNKEILTSKTVISLVHDQQYAQALVSRIEQAGIGRNNVQVYNGASTDLTSTL